MFAEKRAITTKDSEGVGIVRTVGKDFLKKEPKLYFEKAEYTNGKTVDGKWTRALLNHGERAQRS